MAIQEIVDDKPELKGVLEGIVEAEEGDDTPIDDAWTYNDIPDCRGWQLSMLDKAGIIELVRQSSNGPNLYRLADKDEVKTALGEIESKTEDETEAVRFDFTEVEPPSFDSIVGYDDVKFILRKALTADKRVNVLLAGPPSLGKSIFLMEIEEAVEKASYGYGSEDTSAGLIQLLFEKRPQVLLIDEVEEMSNEHYSVLEQLMEHGKITERKYGKTREMEIDTRVFGACNDVDRIPAPIESRFRVMHLDEYERDEFIEVVGNVLVEKEDVDADTARTIGERVHDEYESNDIRDAIGIARLADSPDEVDRVIEALSEHKEQ